MAATKSVSLETVWNSNSKAGSNSEPPEFKSLAQVLREEEDWRPVVAAIEALGIIGWDRFGRWGEYKPDQQPVRDALDAIAEVIKQSMLEDDSFDANGYIDDLEGYHNLHSVGWPTEKLPDLNLYSFSTPVQAKKRQSSRRVEQNDLLLIAYLLKLLTGEEGGISHSVFGSDKLIKDYAEDNLKLLDGLSRRTMETKFSSARKHWTDRIKNQK